MTFKDKALRFAGIGKARVLSAEVNPTSIMVTYYLLLSIFPLMIVLGNLLPLLRIEAEDALPYIETLLPELIQPVLEPIVTSMLTTSNTGFLSLGAVTALWSASKCINYLQVGANQAYGIEHNKSYVAKRIISVVTLLLIGLLLVAIMLAFSFGEALLAWIEPLADWVEPLLGIVSGVKWPVTLVISFLIMTLIYVVAPEAKVRIRDAMPGALFTSVGLLLLVRLFAVYVLFAAGRFSGYGAIGSFFVMLIWLNWSAKIVLLGAVLNATVQEYRFGPVDSEKNRIDAIIDDKVLRRARKWLKRRRKKRQRAAGAAAEPSGKPAAPAPEEEGPAS